MVVYILALTYGQHIETSFIVNKQNRSIPSLTFCLLKKLTNYRWLENTQTMCSKLHYLENDKILFKKEDHSFIWETDPF